MQDGHRHSTRAAAAAAGARLSAAGGLPEAQGLAASMGWVTLPYPVACKETGFPAVLPISVWQKMFSPRTGPLALQLLRSQLSPTLRHSRP